MLDAADGGSSVMDAINLIGVVVVLFFLSSFFSFFQKCQFCSITKSIQDSLLFIFILVTRRIPVHAILRECSRIQQ